jgi:hypothetical protein
MAGFYFPINQKFVNMQPKPGDLVSFKPRSSCDEWFAISVFPQERELSRLKTHMFIHSCGSKKHPLASLFFKGTGFSEYGAFAGNLVE